MNRVIAQIHHFQSRLANHSEAQLLEESLSLLYRVRSGVKLHRLAPEAFALVREAARRALGMEHFDVQLIGGLQLVHGRITEIATGEGKTLVATLPVYLHALRGKGAHVATVNDYLAGRDAEMMSPVYQMLGLKVGTVQTNSTPEQRRAAYRADITYGTAKEFGFDFLRDRLALQGTAQPRNGSSSGALMRSLNYVLVDEADSVLIDEARTPMIIAVPAEDNRLKNDCFQWANENASKFIEGKHYKYEHKERRVKLEPAGRILIRQLPQNEGTHATNVHQLEKYMQNAIKVYRDYHLDKHYTVTDKGEIVIIDEFSGRPSEGRKWQDGIHQAVETKEKVEVTPENRAGASVTVQNFFLLYDLLAGMTGTALAARREFKKIYKKRVVCINTRLPCIREAYPVRVCKTWDEKWNAIVAEVRQMLTAGRSVLIGTRSVERSEVLSKLLNDLQIEHSVLNARHLATEAEIIKHAGEPGRVTVATNMAGRGTDIILAESVKRNGGLHVILTEIHESPRIDRQFIGRCARQGDPGSFRVYVSLEDEILTMGVDPKYAQQLAEKIRSSWSTSFEPFRRAQRRIQRRYFVDRLILHRHQKEHRERLLEMGQDPYLDVPH
jgi:preprotein translocase subunit SecA